MSQENGQVIVKQTLSRHANVKQAMVKKKKSRLFK